MTHCDTITDIIITLLLPEAFAAPGLWHNCQLGRSTVLIQGLIRLGILVDNTNTEDVLLSITPCDIFFINETLIR